jgi:KaiC/GvpD/RAD55 family RecA-like ATPase
VWLIPDLLPEGGIGMFYGEPGSFKSFLTMDIALALSYPIETFGYTIKEPITTVYVAGESAHILGKVRRPAWRIGRGIDRDSPFYLVTDMPLAQDAENFLKLAKSLDMGNIKPKLIVIDTMSASLEGLNENAGEDVGKFLGGCRQLKKLYGCTIIIIHHVGKDLTRGARGWSGLRGSVDFAIFVEANDETKAVQCRVTKMRDAEIRKQPWTFQGIKLAGALVFNPTTPEQHAELWNNVPKLDRAAVGAALRSLKAIDPNRITTHVLAEQMTPQNKNHSVEDRKAAVSATKRALTSLAKTELAGYTAIEDKEVWWFLPSDQS